MNVLILGSGMYVTGRNNTGNATILSSLIQISKEETIDKITIVSLNNRKDSIKNISDKINKKLNTTTKVEFISLKEKVLKDILKKDNYFLSIISTPDHTHFKYIKILLKNNIHILCVKPLVNTIKENKKLIKLQEKHNVLGLVEFHKRFDEANLYTKEQILNNKIGDILYYSVDYSQQICIPTKVFKKWVNYTNIFQYLGVHYVDLFYFFTGFKPLKVTAQGTYGILKEKGIDTYDSIHVTIIWETNKGNECISTFNTNWIDPNCSSAMSDQKYKIIGTKGRIENDHKNRGIELVTSDNGIQHANPYFSDYLLNPNNGYDFNGYAYKSIKQFFLDAISFSENSLAYYDQNRPTFKQTLYTTAIIQAVNKSLNHKSKWENINV